jgi:hypothetical protein
LDVNYFRRFVNNYADDDQIDNTTISFPIAFRKAIVYGAEGKLDVPEWQAISGFLSYSYQVGNAWNPVTGGLFFGDNATQAEQQLTGHFPDSQDQRNTVRGRLRYQLRRAYGLQAACNTTPAFPLNSTATPPPSSPNTASRFSVASTSRAAALTHRSRQMHLPARNSTTPIA